MSVNQKIAHNTAIQLVGKVISTMLGLAAVSMMEHFLGIQSFGWYVTAVGILQFIGIFSDFGFTLTTSYLLAHENDQIEIFNTLFTWRFISALIFYSLTTLIVFCLPYPFPIKLAVLIIAASFFAQTLNQVFIGYHQTRLTTIITTGGEILGRLVLVAGIFFSRLSNHGFLWSMVSISLASLVYTFFLIFRHKEKISWQWSTRHSRRILTATWPTAVTIMFNAIYLQGDRVILPFYVSSQAIGLYGGAYRILDIVVQFAAIIMGIMMPLLTHAWTQKNRPEFLQRFQLSFDLIFFFLMPMLSGIVALAPQIMHFVGGEQFSAGGPILRFLSWTILGISVGNIFGYTALAINQQKKAIAIYASDAALSLLGYFIFIPRYGLFGAAGVTIFSEAYAGLGLFLLIYTSTKWSPRLLNVGKILFSSLLMGILIYYLQFLPLFIDILIGMLIYAALAVVLRIIPRQTWQEIVRLKKPSFETNPIL